MFSVYLKNKTIYKAMKKILSWSIVGVFLVSMISSCGSSRAKCDAYGYNFETPMEVESDLAQR